MKSHKKGAAVAICAALSITGPITGPAPYEASQKLAGGRPELTATRPVLPADGINTDPDMSRVDKNRLHNIRVLKAERIVQTFANYEGKSGFLPYVEDLVSYCEELAEKHGEPKFADTWYYALVYGYANFGLRCYSIARYADSADCTGPYDVKKEPHVLDPVENMRHHVDEQFLGWQLGYRGRGLCEYVMLPSAPRDWGGGKFAQTDRKFKACIQRGYEVGKIR